MQTLPRLTPAALLTDPAGRVAIAAANAELACAGLLKKGAASATVNASTERALDALRRRHMIVGSSVDDATLAALALGGDELELRALLLVLRERVADAAGLLEDGSAADERALVADRDLDLVTSAPAPGRGLVDAAKDADDFVVMSATKRACEEAEARVRQILGRLGLQLHPDKTRRVELYDGKEGFDFLGCHLHKRMSGKLWEQKRKRLYFLQRWPSARAMRRIRARVKELTPRSRCHADLREVIADLNPVLRGWGNYFRTGNAATRFNQLDSYVYRRLRTLRVKRKGRQLKAGEATRWTREYFENIGLHRLRGTVRYPEQPFWKEGA